MPKILIFANHENTILNFRREVIAAFVKNGFDVTVCYPLGDNTESIKELGCTVVDLPLNRHGTNPIKDMLLVKKCKALINQYKPDIVLTYTVKPNVYSSIACQLTKTPYINNVTGLGSIIQSSNPLAKLVLKLQKIGYKKSSCVFFQNESNREQLKACGVISDKTRTVMIPGSGVNLEKQKYEDFPKDDGIIRFVIVSKLRDDKGYNEFFEAVKRIKAKYDNVEFHVVGRYDEEKYVPIVEELVQKNLIIYHGLVLQEEVHEIEKGCNCLIHPSYHEGMANVILEAAATGRPVLASNIPGCKEGVEDGKTGYLFNVKDADSLCEAIEKMINTPYDRQLEMGRLGREKMEKEFDRQFVASKYIEIINEITGGKNNG